MDRARGPDRSGAVQRRGERVEQRRLPARRLHLSEVGAQRAAAAAMTLTAQISAAVALTAALLAAQTDRGSGALERGTLPPRWTPEHQDCAREDPFLVHEYNPAFIIIRQSGCTNFEKPFLYLLFGSKEALLVDTGATGGQPADVVGTLIARHAQREHQPPLPLLVVHSHGHGDHVAGDSELAKRANTRVVEGKAETVAQFFAIRGWPDARAEYDLGD